MRTLRPLFLASALILALTSPASAGEMTTGAAPPSASAQGGMSTTANGDMQNGVAGDIHTGIGEEADTGDSVAAAVLGLVQSVLSLL